jgi:hypothetical protein
VCDYDLNWNASSIASPEFKHALGMRYRRRNDGRDESEKKDDCAGLKHSASVMKRPDRITGAVEA